MAVDKYVYRTRDPEIVALWDDYQAEHAKWRRKVKRLIGSWFPRQGRGGMVQSGWGSESWVGISGRWSERNDLPEGWRWDNRRDMVVPFKKTKEGKEFAKVIAANQPPTSLRNRLPGMPAFLWSGRHGLRTFSPGIEQMGDALYVIWAVELVADEDKYDPKIWKRVRLSEYHRLREAAEVAA